MPSRYRDSVAGINDAARPSGPKTSTPGRLLRWFTLPVLGVLACGLLLAGSVGALRDDLGLIGARAEPQTVAAARLCDDLAAMDGAAADFLLVGDATGLGATRAGIYQSYGDDQKDANRQLEILGSGIEDIAQDGAATYLAIENGLSQYTQYVAYAMYIDGETHGQRPGQPPAAALQAYEHAESLMTATDGTGVRAAAHQLFLDEQQTQAQPVSDSLATIWRLRLFCGLLLAFIVVTLLLAQRKLGRTFRRVINPPLVLATAITVIFGVLLFSALGSAKSSYDALNRFGPDSVVTLWDTRAATAEMNASESRWLLDAGSPSAQHRIAMDGEQQAFTSSESSLANLPSGKTAADFRAYLADDTHLRSLVTVGSGSPAARLRMAVAYKTGTSAAAFAKYDADLGQAIGVDQQAFIATTAHGRDGLVTWLWLPWLWMAATIALVVRGFLPRLREYR
jgi:hypothetical protein